MAESDEDLGFGRASPDWAWKVIWSMYSGCLVVRPVLTWAKLDRPVWQLVVLILLWIPVVAAIANCWRPGHHFGINRWPGVLVCGAAGVLAGFAEFEGLRPVTGPAIFGGLAVFGSVWILSKAKQGQTAEFPPELIQFVNRPRWKYVTPLKLDFWFIWLGMWLPGLFAGFVLYREMHSAAYAHWHWSFLVLYGVVLTSLVFTAARLMSVHSLSRSVKDREFDPFLILNLSISLLLGAVLYNGLHWKNFFGIGFSLVILEIPREAMVRWHRRNSRAGRETYESLEAPHIGI